MQAAHLLQHFRSRTQVEVVGVAQDDVGLQNLQHILRVEPLDAAHRADRHKNRGLDRTVRGGDGGGAGAAVGGLKLEFHGSDTLRLNRDIIPYGS